MPVLLPNQMAAFNNSVLVEFYLSVILWSLD